MRVAVFYRKFVSQQPEVVESRVIAHFVGFFISNTIKWVLSILETELKKEEIVLFFSFCFLEALFYKISSSNKT